MKFILPLFLTCLFNSLFAQGVYTITADSVKLTGCDSSELILENHTRNVPGFLFNNGSGKTIFKRPLTKISDTFYLVGADTLKMRDPNVWLNSPTINSFGTIGKFGTLDKNNIDFYTNNHVQMTLDTFGSLLIGGATSDSGRYKLKVINGPTRIAPFMRVSLQSAITFDVQFGQASNVFGTNINGVGLGFAYGPACLMLENLLGNIPANSLVMGGTSPGNLNALVDSSYNPVFVVNGSGAVTINGGYSGIASGTNSIASNANAFNFNINGAIGTGSGGSGDLAFLTGNTQAAGVIHTMSNRWWVKGRTGYLSNVSNPASLMDITSDSAYAQLRLRTSYTPSSSSDTNGNTGDFAWDTNYIYIKTSSGWKRGTMTTF